MRCLVVRYGVELLRFPLPPADAVLGADVESALFVPFPGVSRRHLRVVPDGDLVRLFDLGSKNGLWVNGERVRESLLHSGAEVKLGSVSLSLGDADSGDLELGVRLRRPAQPQGGPGPGGDRTTSTGGFGGTVQHALRLLWDLGDAAGPGRLPASLAVALQRIREIIGAETVFLLTRLPGSAPAVTFRDGAVLDDAVVAAAVLSCSWTGSARRAEVVDVPGHTILVGPLGGAQGRVPVVVLPAARPLETWHLEFVDAVADSLAAMAEAPSSRVPADRRETSRLVVPAGMVRGLSPAIQRLLHQLEKAVPSPLDVLLIGETGTGKELVARMLHASGPRAEGPFVAINCAAIPAELLESELFGVRARVATGVDPRPGQILAAHGGTLLLDEVGEMPLPLQPKLLRFLQEREVQTVGSALPRPVDVRVISCSNRDLGREAREGRFRADLFYRLSAVQLHVPPLRDRREDIPALVMAFAESAAAAEGKWVKGVSRRALALLQGHDWPGNIRELKNEVFRAVLFCPGGGVLGVEQFAAVAAGVDSSSAARARPGPAPLPSPAREAGPEHAAGAVADGRPSLDLRARVASAEREAIEAALVEAGGNRSVAARLLGISRQALFKKLRRE